MIVHHQLERRADARGDHASEVDVCEVERAVVLRVLGERGREGGLPFKQDRGVYFWDELRTRMMSEEARNVGKGRRHANRNSVLSLGLGRRGCSKRARAGCWRGPRRSNVACAAGFSRSCSHGILRRVRELDA